MSERELGATFAASLPFHYRARGCLAGSMVAAEVDGPVRRADFVQVDWLGECRPDEGLLGHLSVFKSLLCSRVFLAARRRGRCTRDQLWQDVGHSLTTVRGCLGQLTEHGWLEALRGGQYAVSAGARVPGFRISTFELKVRDWRRARHQLAAHLLFADRAVLVMPRPCKADTAEEVLRACQQLGASLVFADSTRPRVVLWQLWPAARPDWHLTALGHVAARGDLSCQTGEFLESGERS